MWLEPSGGKDVRSLERREHALGLGLIGQTEQGKHDSLAPCAFLSHNGVPREIFCMRLPRDPSVNPAAVSLCVQLLTKWSGQISPADCIVLWALTV